MTRHRETITTAPSRATVLGSGINAAVRRIALEYTDRGQLSKVSSHNNATVGSGTIVNQVALSYNAFNQLTEDAQSHSGAVAGSTPKVSYSYADGTANQTRRLTTTYPSDKLITMSYGTANSADDRLSRLAGVALTCDPGTLGPYGQPHPAPTRHWVRLPFDGGMGRIVPNHPALAATFRGLWNSQRTTSSACQRQPQSARFLEDQEPYRHFPISGSSSPQHTSFAVFLRNPDFGVFAKPKSELG